MVERFCRRNILRRAADDQRELHLVVVAPVGVHELHAFACADDRARRLEEHPDLVDLLDEIAVVDALVGERLLEVLLVIHRRGNDLAGVRDGGQQLHLVERRRLVVLRQALHLRRELGEVRDQRIVARERVVHGREFPQRVGYVVDTIVGNEAETVMIEAADFHGRAF